MRTHMSTADKIEKEQKEKLHYCTICKKGFKAQANLITHKCKVSIKVTRMYGSNKYLGKYSLKEVLNKQDS